MTSDSFVMLPQHLKQIRVLMLNDKEELEKTLFRLEQGNALSQYNGSVLLGVVYETVTPEICFPCPVCGSSGTIR